MYFELNCRNWDNDDDDNDDDDDGIILLCINTIRYESFIKKKWEMRWHDMKWNDIVDDDDDDDDDDGGKKSDTAY